MLCSGKRWVHAQCTIVNTWDSHIIKKKIKIKSAKQWSWQHQQSRTLMGALPSFHENTAECWVKGRYKRELFSKLFNSIRYTYTVFQVKFYISFFAIWLVLTNRKAQTSCNMKHWVWSHLDNQIEENKCSSLLTWFKPSFSSYDFFNERNQIFCYKKIPYSCTHHKFLCFFWTLQYFMQYF